MRILCVGRHSVLAEHLASLFRDYGAETRAAVGLADASEAARSFVADAVVCDYDLLATVSLTEWENDPSVSHVPILAVSLTRRPEEVHLLDVNNVAGFLYLPALEHDDGVRLLDALRRREPPSPAVPRIGRGTPGPLRAC
jgi:CheY-like chemotaxis protein